MNDDELIERLNSWGNSASATHSADITKRRLMREAASRLTELTRALDEIMTEYRNYGAVGIDVMFDIAKTARGFEPSTQGKQGDE